MLALLSPLSSLMLRLDLQIDFTLMPSAIGLLGNLYFMYVCSSATVGEQPNVLHVMLCDTFLTDCNLRLPFCRSHSQIDLLKRLMVHLETMLLCQDPPANLIQTMTE